MEQRRITEPVQMPDVAASLERACDKLRSSTRILLTSHRRPDGDGTGSFVSSRLLRRQASASVEAACRQALGRCS